MDAYRLREPSNENKDVTHKIWISPPPLCKGKNYSTAANG
jgi:hypothetical protein